MQNDAETNSVKTRWRLCRLLAFLRVCWQPRYQDHNRSSILMVARRTLHRHSVKLRHIEPLLCERLKDQGVTSEVDSGIPRILPHLQAAALCRGDKFSAYRSRGPSLKREAAGIVIVASREEELLTRPKIYQDILS